MFGEFDLGKDLVLLQDELFVEGISKRSTIISR